MDLGELSTSQRILAVFWIAAGVNHFLIPRSYQATVPDWIPAHREMVIWSGVAEIVGGVAVVPPATRRFARWWLLGVLAAVYPANVHMALHPERYQKVPPIGLWARLPLQFAAAYWLWKATED